MKNSKSPQLYARAGEITHAATANAPAIRYDDLYRWGKSGAVRTQQGEGGRILYNRVDAERAALRKGR